MNHPAPTTDQAAPHATAARPTSPYNPRHFLALPDARTVPTTALDTVAYAVAQSLAARSILCIYGDAGCGKTFTLHTALTYLATPWPAPASRAHLCVLSPRPAPTPTSLRAELLPATGPTLPPTHDPGVLDAALRTQLTTRPYLLALDDASRLTAGCVEYLSYLFDDPTTQITLVLVTTSIRTLRRQPLLTSRPTRWLPIHPLTSAEVHEFVPDFHPFWHDVDETVLDHLDAAYGHGNFRRWAQLTHHALRLQRRSPRPAAAVLEGLLDSLLAPHEITHDDDDHADCSARHADHRRR